MGYGTDLPKGCGWLTLAGQSTGDSDIVVDIASIVAIKFLI
jgi:hypothetical protein